MVAEDKASEAQEQARQFVEGMTSEEKMLLTLRDELYGGRWEEMDRDLEERLAGRPYVFKLASRIEDDLARIRRMGAFEDKWTVNLKDYV
jgi:hypothetical protein